LLDYLIREVKNEISNVRIKNICIYVAYTRVLLSDKYASVAYMLVQESSDMPSIWVMHATWLIVSASKIIYDSSPDLIEANIGVIVSFLRI